MRAPWKRRFRTWKPPFLGAMLVLGSVSWWSYFRWCSATLYSSYQHVDAFLCRSCFPIGQGIWFGLLLSSTRELDSESGSWKWVDSIDFRDQLWPTFLKYGIQTYSNLLIITVYMLFLAFVVLVSQHTPAVFGSTVKSFNRNPKPETLATARPAGSLVGKDGCGETGARSWCLDVVYR